MRAGISALCMQECACGYKVCAGINTFVCESARADTSVGAGISVCAGISALLCASAHV